MLVDRVFWWFWLDEVGVDQLLEVLDEGDDECALREQHAGHPGQERDRLPCERKLQIELGGELFRIQFFEGFGDALGLRAGKTALLEFSDDAVGIDD